MTDRPTEDVDAAILGYLLTRAVDEDGSVGQVAKAAAMHGYANTERTPMEAAARSKAVRARVRELVGRYDDAGE